MNMITSNCHKLRLSIASAITSWSDISVSETWAFAIGIISRVMTAMKVETLKTTIVGMFHFGDRPRTEVCELLLRRCVRSWIINVNSTVLFSLQNRWFLPELRTICPNLKAFRCLQACFWASLLGVTIIGNKLPFKSQGSPKMLYGLHAACSEPLWHLSSPC